MNKLALPFFYWDYHNVIDVAWPTTPSHYPHPPPIFFLGGGGETKLSFLQTPICNFSENSELQPCQVCRSRVSILKMSCFSFRFGKSSDRLLSFQHICISEVIRAFGTNGTLVYTTRLISYNKVNETESQLSLNQDWNLTSKNKVDVNTAKSTFPTPSPSLSAPPSPFSLYVQTKHRSPKNSSRLLGLTGEIVNKAWPNKIDTDWRLSHINCALIIHMDEFVATLVRNCSLLIHSIRIGGGGGGYSPKSYRYVRHRHTPQLKTQRTTPPPPLPHLREIQILLSVSCRTRC